jgi:hypothetical protein
MVITGVLHCFALLVLSVPGPSPGWGWWGPGPNALSGTQPTVFGLGVRGDLLPGTTTITADGVYRKKGPEGALQHQCAQLPEVVSGSL